MGRAPFVSCNFFEKRIAAAHIYQAAVHIMIFNKEERTYWIESYKNFPTSNISDAMDNLGLRSGVVLGLHRVPQASRRHSARCAEKPLSTGNL